jgi:hypothetical protein
MGKMTNTAQLGDIIKVPGKPGLYVVERAEEQGAGIGHHPGDQYPNGHHITARLLGDKLSYDAQRESISFYQSGVFDLAQTQLIEQVEVVGTMQRTFGEPTGEAVAPAPVVVPTSEPEAVAAPVVVPTSEPEAVAAPEARVSTEKAVTPKKAAKKKAVKKKAVKKKAVKPTAVEYPGVPAEAEPVDKMAEGLRDMAARALVADHGPHTAEESKDA